MWHGCSIMVSVLFVLVTYGSDEAGIPSADSMERSLLRLNQQLSGPDIQWPRGTEQRVAPEKRSSQADDVVAAMARAASVETRLSALAGLQGSERLRSVDICVEGLADPDPRVRRAAARVLASLDSDQVFRRTMEIMDSGSDESVAGLDAAVPRLRPLLESRMMGALESEAATPARQAVAA